MTLPAATNVHFNKYLLFVVLIILLVTLPFIGLVGLTIYVPVFLLSCFLPTSYGKFISYFDTWLDEDFVTSIPRCSIVATLTLNGDISLQELKSIFQKQVLEARSKANPKILRYPELTQYLTTFVCFRIWKKDPSFCIENHIIEHQNFIGNLDDIHGDMSNKTFENNRSPWELVLFRNVTLTDENVNLVENEPKSVVALRSHHILADAKSLLKLLVECLGNKTLKVASSTERKETVWEKIKFIVSFPVKYLIGFIKVSVLAFQSHNHIWKVNDDRNAKTVIRFSSHIRLADIKNVAKVNNVKTSAVIMSIISGAIRKYSDNIWNKEVAIGYVLPKPNHPEKLGNHLYWGTLTLPLDQACERKRLQNCNSDFVHATVNKQGIYWNWSILLSGFLVFPLTRFAVNILTPIGISNNAGEEEGFSVGTHECTDYRLSVGPLKGTASLMFCTVSYKDGLRIAVIGKQNVLSNEIVENIAKQISYELQLLM